MASSYISAKGEHLSLIEVWGYHGQGILKKSQEISLHSVKDSRSDQHRGGSKSQLYLDDICGISVTPPDTNIYYIGVAFRHSGNVTLLSYKQNVLKFMHRMNLRAIGVEVYGVQFFDNSFWVLGTDRVLNKLQLELDC